MFQEMRKAIDIVVPPISAALFLIATGSTVLGAAVRTSGISFPVVWVEEVTRYCMIWATLLLMGIGFRKGTQTQFTLLEEHLHGRVKCMLKICILILEMVMFGILVIGGARLAIMNANQRSAVMMISMTWPYLAIPVSSFLVELELLMMLIETLRELFRGETGSPVQEVGEL